MMLNSEDNSAEYKKGRAYALGRLNRRECSSEDLRKRLHDQDISPETTDLIIADLSRTSLVSDERFSRMLIRQQATRSKGPRFIRQKLKEQGISLSTQQISEISAEATDKTELETARAFVERKYPTAFEDKKVAFKASQGLLRRGFSYDVIQQALKLP